MGSGGMSSKRLRKKIAGLPYKGAKVKPIDIDKFKGWTLSQVEARLRTLDHEELFVFDKKGRIVAAFRGGKHSVPIPPGLKDIKNVVVTHGHPTVNVGGYGGTLSFADMGVMLNSKWAGFRATASGKGELNYIMRRGRKADPKAFLDQIDADKRALSTKATKTYNAAYKEALANGKSQKAAIFIARQKQVGLFHAYYKENAAKYGFEYVARKDPYEY